MKKVNKKGFVLAETIVISVVVITALVVIYIQFSNIDNSYYRSFSYNNVDKLYLTNQLKQFISNSNNNDIYNNLNHEVLYIDVTDCSEFTEYMYCTSLMDAMDAKKVIITNNNTTDLISNLKSYDFSEVMNSYIKNSKSKESGYRIIVEYNDNSVAGLSILTGDTTKTFADVALGDYISMVPTGTQKFYTPGYGLPFDTEVITYPKELNLWRVININEDGTIDMVSEYVSSTVASFANENGYKKYVGLLNIYASGYENTNYTINTRYMGYNGQTEYISDTSLFVNPPVLTATTTDNSNEAIGGGDILYQRDFDLVKNALGTTVAYKVGTTTPTAYWLSGRMYKYYSNTAYMFSGYYVNTAGEKADHVLRLYAGGWQYNTPSYALRPIVTLKSGLTATGSGTSSDPWILQ